MNSGISFGDLLNQHEVENKAQHFKDPCRNPRACVRACVWGGETMWRVQVRRSSKTVPDYIVSARLAHYLKQGYHSL
jgi:hypothetical protein